MRMIHFFRFVFRAVLHIVELWYSFHLHNPWYTPLLWWLLFTIGERWSLCKLPFLLSFRGFPQKFCIVIIFSLSHFLKCYTFYEKKAYSFSYELWCPRFRIKKECCRAFQSKSVCDPWNSQCHPWRKCRFWCVWYVLYIYFVSKNCNHVKLFMIVY